MDARIQLSDPMSVRETTAESATFRVRLATERDVPGVVGCLRQAFEPYRHAYTPDAYDDTVTSEEAAHERLRGMRVLVAEDPAGAIVGTIACARVSGTEGHLRGMAVRPDWQGSRAARALLDGALDHLRSIGCRRVTLDTTLPLVRATRFYEKNGFRKSGKITDFFGMPLAEYFRDLS